MIGSMSQSNEKNTSIEELHAVVHGYVQGVGFRYFASRRALSLGLRGYARNKGHGSVEVVAQGPRGALENFLVALRQGPTAAEVDEVVATWRGPTEHFSGFSIRY
ncbi:MAG: acylphosphatase [Ktedonobacteraceae bacterium]